MGIPTGQSKTWTARRVGDIRRVRDIHGYHSADKDGEWLTMRDASRPLKMHSSGNLILSDTTVREPVRADEEKPRGLGDSVRIEGVETSF
jgi:hypothetical protein